MKCHPLRWMWGLIPIVLFSWLASFDLLDRVEGDLAARTLAALKAANLGWAKVAFDGRDGSLTGEAPDETEPGRAIQLATAINGVRVLESQADLLRKVEPYTLSASSRDGRLTLTGFVPSEAARKAILAAAKSAFPKSEVDDKLELARGNPSAADWLAAVRFELRQLSILKSGRAELSDLHGSLEGEASSTAAFKEVKTALSTGLPAIMRLGSDKVTPPVIAPYLWLAKLSGKQVVLSGYVPSEHEHIELLTHAKRAFGTMTITDRLELGEGSPEGFEKAARLSLDQLATLQEGSAEVQGRDLTLQGIASDEPTAEAARKSFKSAAPASFKISEAITASKAFVSPYVTTVEASPSGIELSGFVPNAATRAALVIAAKARFPTRTVTDRLQIAGGEQEGYDTCLYAGLMGLSKLGNGRVELVDKVVTVHGTTQDEALSENLAAVVRTEAKSACETTVKVSYDDSAKRKAAENAADDAKRQAAAVATQEATQAAKACEGDLRSTANSGTVTFDTASDVLSHASRPTLRALAEIAQRCAHVLIEIGGHTDSDGIPERNQPLSERRAQAVVDFLVGNGVDATRIKAVGYGDTRPIAPNDTPENRAKNRRIEFSVKSQ